MENSEKSRIKEAKAECRREARARLKETDAGYRSAASAAICSAVLELAEYKDAEVILAYSPVGREVDTGRLLEAILDDGKSLCLPRCTDIDENGKKKEGIPEMEARLVAEPGLMSTGAYGIKEPVVYMTADGEGSCAGDSGQNCRGKAADPDNRTADEERTDKIFPLVSPEEIDLVILPCVACDPRCSRLGHGAGYYDKFLSELREDCVTIAVCFDKLILDDIPMEEHDMPVRAVISEKAVYRWRPEDTEC